MGSRHSWNKRRRSSTPGIQEEIKFKNGRYSVPLPWREGNFHVPQNKGLKCNLETCEKCQKYRKNMIQS